jgi:lipopolysaccharide exporter
LLSFVGTKSLTFIATLVLARLLEPSAFGVLAAVLAFITVLELISDLGMKATVIYESEHGVTKRVQTAFTLNLAFTIVLTAIAVGLAPFVARFLGAEGHEILFAVASLDLLLRGLGNVHDALLLRDMEFRQRIVPQLISNLARGIAMIGLAVAGLGASALVIGFIIGSAVWTLTLWIVRPFRPNLTIDRSAVRGIAAYGGWATALELIAAVGQRADVVVIGNVLGSRALGFYTIAQRVPELLVGNVAWNLSVVAFPALSQRRDRRDGSLVETTINLLRYSSLFALPVGVFLAVLAEPIVVVLFGQRWAEAGGIMQALAILFGTACVILPLGDAFKALGKQPIMVAVNAVAVPAMIGAMLLASSAGVVAIAWARTGVGVLQVLVWLVLTGRLLELPLARVVRGFRPGVVGAAGVALGGLAARTVLPEPSLIPLLVGTIAAGLGALLALRAFARPEYAELRELVHRHVLSTAVVPARWRRSSPVGPLEVERAVEVSEGPADAPGPTSPR